MKLSAISLFGFLFSCGAMEQIVIQPACARGDCLVEWTHSCQVITAGQSTYDIFNVPGYYHKWGCGWYQDSWRQVELTWVIEDGCFTEPAVTVSNCYND